MPSGVKHNSEEIFTHRCQNNLKTKDEREQKTDQNGKKRIGTKLNENERKKTGLNETERERI